MIEFLFIQAISKTSKTSNSFVIPFQHANLNSIDFEGYSTVFDHARLRYGAYTRKNGTFPRVTLSSKRKSNKSEHLPVPHRNRYKYEVKHDILKKKN